MRETHKKKFVTLHKNLNRAIAPIVRSKQFEHNNAIEKLQVISSDKEYLALQQLNNYQSNFFVLVVLTIVTYIFILDTFLRFNLKSGLVFNTMLQAIWGIIGYQFIKRSVLPKEVYGLTLTNWKIWYMEKQMVF